VQYELHLPSDIVWVHVSLATISWLAVLWTVAAAGRLVPRRVEVAETYAPPLPTYSPARSSGAAAGGSLRR
jgi:cytochrome c oxidase assembly protein subunit 15